MKAFFEEYKVYVIIVIFLVVGLITYFVVTNFFSKTNTSDIIANSNDIIEKTNKEETQKENLTVNTIRVDIKGAVSNPGVYEFETGKRVIDLINMAGGLTKNADVTLINLSKILSDEMVVKIYTKDEVKSIKKGNTQTVIKYIETECTCPHTINDACIIGSGKDSDISDETTMSNKISINTAMLDELTTLPNIGSAKAEKIIEYRNTNGNFKTIEDIKNVSGIGEALFEKIKNYITI